MVAEDVFFPCDIMGAVPLRDRVGALEAVLLTLEQAEMPVKHEFVDGLYRRELTFPAGTLATGAIHKTDHMDVLLSGEMIVVTDDGLKTLKAPLSMISRAGVKKVGYAVTEVTWATYHPNPDNITDIEKLEADNITNDYSNVEIMAEFETSATDQDDYRAVIEELGYTEEQVQAEVNIDNVIEADPDDVVEMGDSKIHGIGMIATMDISNGTIVAVAASGDKRRPPGRYTNHAAESNCEMINNDNDLLIISVDDIAQGEEITINYRQAHSLRGK